MTKADSLFRRKIIKIFCEKKNIIDIGGGLRISKDKGNRFQPDRQWIVPYAKKVNYQVLDPVPDFNPDIIGDIHQLPLKNNSVEALICMAVLEHVKDPVKACREMHRVLEPGGYCLVYLPFLYYYHAEKGYYHDYWRFTHDSFALLFKDFSRIEYAGLDGAIETWLRISPLGKSAFLRTAARCLDRAFHKSESNQTSGYNIFLTK
jgi:SAM-dependent methyltransferase